MEAWERIELIMEKEGLNKNSFSKAIGMGNNVTITRIVNEHRTPSRSTCEKITEAFPKYTVEWILTGIGDTVSDDTNDITSDTNNLNDVVSDSFHSQDYKMVPIVHIDSVGGIHSPNSIVDETQYIQGYAPFTDAREGDICIIQSGDSMVPTCPSGSLLLLRHVPSWKEYFGYGNIFVIELIDGRRITKEVTRYDNDPDNYIWCVSHNPDVPDEELPKSLIRSVWKVIKILINKGW